ncbi:hypothetical protein LJC34_00320 [Oscillospiraceae bacterium OttesenSCG-928-G22]|nr:hypothetical protein [Oscillospiraceae bacterium OttesenSCG-928-G22]
MNDIFDYSHCKPDSGSIPYEGEVLVLRASVLREQFRTAPNQLWLAESGFGCKPNASGRAVYAICLADGEKSRWNRADFIGIVRDDCMPDWAREQLAQLTQAQSPEPRMDEIT